MKTTGLEATLFIVDAKWTEYEPGKGPKIDRQAQRNTGDTMTTDPRQLAMEAKWCRLCKGTGIPTHLASPSRCERCSGTGQLDDALADALLAALDECERLQKLVLDYENGICWETNCTNCAKLLDGSIAETHRAEQAEAECERLRRGDLTIAEGLAIANAANKALEAP